MARENIGRQMEILLVEDSLVDAALTIGALKESKIKHRLTLVRDGAEAMEFVRRQGRFAQAPRPDLILLDLLLPKKDGLDVLEDLRQDAGLKEIPVVVMTSSDSEEDKRRCEQHRVEHYVTKPIQFDTFLVLLAQLRHHWHSDLILPAMD